MNKQQNKLQKELEELEKRISKTKTSTMSEENVKNIVENEINPVAENVEMLYAELSTLSYEMEETQTELENITLGIEETGIKLETLSNEVDNMQTNLNQNIENVEAVQYSLRGVQTELENTQTVINNTVEDFENFKEYSHEEFNNFNTTLSNLSQVAYTGSYNDLVDLPTSASTPSPETEIKMEDNPDFYSCVLNRNTPATLIPFDLFLSCEPGHLVKGQLRFLSAYAVSSNVLLNCDLLLNEEEIICNTVASLLGSGKSKSHVIFEFAFMPKQRHNKLSVKIQTNSGPSYTFYKVVANVTGKNTMVLNTSNHCEVSAFDSTVCLGRMSFNTQHDMTLTYFTNDFENPEDIVYSKFEKITGLGFNSFMVWPNGNLGSMGFSQNNSTCRYEYFTPEGNSYYVTYPTNPFFLTIKPSFCTNSAIECVREFKYVNLAIKTDSITERPYKAVYLKFSKASENPLCLCSNPLPDDTFCDIQPIVPTYTEDIAEETFFGYIIVKNDGNCYFLPDYDSSYYIKLGLGRRPMGYMRNGVITIILGGNNFCTRFVLKKNNSGVWVVVSRHVYEGIDNIRLINHDKYVYVVKSLYPYLDLKEKYFPEVENIDEITYSSLT